jgi:ABC-type Fe3+-hydroxamate transport system substrate-binding protein
MQYQDQLGRHVQLEGVPQRVISLVPSQTELIADLGALSQLTGRTKFCVHPAAIKGVPVVGGTKNIHLEKVHQLQPDLVIANKEENDQSQVEALAERYPVWVSDVTDLDSACTMISDIGQLLDKNMEASRITDVILSGFKEPIVQERSAIYLIWRDPWMAAGSDTFISSMMQQAGLNNLIKSPRYPALKAEEIRQLSPDLILLSSEPYPFKEKHRDELCKIMPDASIEFVDGEMFSWYGSRLIKAVDYFRNFLK